MTGSVGDWYSLAMTIDAAEACDSIRFVAYVLQADPQNLAWLKFINGCFNGFIGMRPVPCAFFELSHE
jgi:hypothetical protein